MADGRWPRIRRLCPCERIKVLERENRELLARDSVPMPSASRPGQRAVAFTAVGSRLEDEPNGPFLEFGWMPPLGTGGWCCVRHDS